CFYTATLAWNPTAVDNINGGGGSGSMFDTSNSDAITYTSDIMNLTGLTSADFSLAFSAITPPFQIGEDGYGTSFMANVAGTFAGAAVPEPSSWAMMVIGAGMVGFRIRSRRSATSIVNA
ncbi:PEPxxWA-CTERM sorting domain-containing protein, partial [Polymorphobacter multimanifer]